MIHGVLTVNVTTLWVDRKNIIMRKEQSERMFYSTLIPHKLHKFLHGHIFLRSPSSTALFVPHEPFKLHIIVVAFSVTNKTHGVMLFRTKFQIIIHDNHVSPKSGRV